MRKILILVAVLVCLQAKILEFENEAIALIFTRKEAALLLLASKNEASSKALEAFKELDETTPSYHLIVSTPTDGHDLYEKLLGYMGLDENISPHLLFLNQKTEKYLYEGDDYTRDELIAFHIRIQKGEVEQFLKSDPIPEEDDKAVRVLVGKNFRDFVYNSEKQILVKFYAPWCGHCNSFAPFYEKAAQLLAAVNPNIIIAKVDSTNNEVAGIDIESFPTLKFFKKDKTLAPIDFKGARTTEGVISWLKEHTEYDWTDISELTEEEL